MFHLFTHAFFKALLFLGAGSVIHAMHHEQDMRNMGGLRRYIPFTYRDDGDRHPGADRLPASRPASTRRTRSSRRPTRRRGRATRFAFLCVVIAAGFTSFYSWRLFFMTFEGPARWGAHAAHDHATPARGARAMAHEADGAPATPRASPTTTTATTSSRPRATSSPTTITGTATTAITRRTRARW